MGRSGCTQAVVLCPLPVTSHAFALRLRPTFTTHRGYVCGSLAPFWLWMLGDQLMHARAYSRKHVERFLATVFTVLGMRLNTGNMFDVRVLRGHQQLQHPAWPTCWWPLGHAHADAK